MNDRLRNAIERLIGDCQFAGGVDMTKDQLEEHDGLIRAGCLVELRNAFRENHPSGESLTKKCKCNKCGLTEWGVYAETCCACGFCDGIMKQS